MRNNKGFPKITFLACSIMFFLLSVTIMIKSTVMRDIYQEKIKIDIFPSISRWSDEHKIIGEFVPIVSVKKGEEKSYNIDKDGYYYVFARNINSSSITVKFIYFL